MRVVAGRLGGRRLIAPKGTETRPTTDRVREAIFSKLGAVDGCAVLDLYAGTGAMGIEALSRGAARCCFVESSRRAGEALRKNLDSLAIGAEAEVRAQRVESLLKGAPVRAFDLIVADPPYAGIEMAVKAIAGLGASGWFEPGARIVIERGKGGPLTAPGLAFCDERRYGDTMVSYFEWGTITERSS